MTWSDKVGLKKFFSGMSQFFNGKTADDEVNGQLQFLRFLFLVGFGVVYITAFGLFENYPQSFAEMDVSTGTLVKVTGPFRGSPGRLTLNIDDHDKIFDFISNIEERETVRELIGNVITIRSYESLGPLYNRVDSALIVDFEGNEVVNNFQKNIARRPSTGLYTLFGFGLCLFTFVLIKDKLKHTALDNDLRKN